MKDTERFVLDLEGDRFLKQFSKRDLNLLEEIMGQSIPREEYKIKFLPLMSETIKYIKECEDNDEENEIGEKFLEFVIWFTSKVEELKSLKLFSDLYDKQMEIFDSIFNEGLYSFSTKNIFDHIPSIAKSSYFQNSEEEKPLSGFEIEGVERVHILYNCDCDFIDIFNNMFEYKGLPWDEFVKIIHSENKEINGEDCENFQEYLRNDLST